MNIDYLCRVQNPFIILDKPEEAEEERVVTMLQIHWTSLRKTKLSEHT